MTITTGVSSNPISVPCESLAWPPLRRPAGVLTRPLPGRDLAVPRAPPGPPRPVPGLLPGSGAPGGAPPRAAAGPPAGLPDPAGAPGRAGPAAGRLPDSQGASWRPDVPWASGADSNGARGPAAARPPARRIPGIPSPSVCADTSRASGGGDQPSTSSIAVQACVTVASAEGSLVASTEYPGSASASHGSPPLPLVPSQEARTDSRFHPENWPGG